MSKENDEIGLCGELKTVSDLISYNERLGQENELLKLERDKYQILNTINSSSAECDTVRKSDMMLEHSPDCRVCRLREQVSGIMRKINTIENA